MVAESEETSSDNIRGEKPVIIAFMNARMFRTIFVLLNLCWYRLGNHMRLATATALT